MFFQFSSTKFQLYESNFIEWGINLFSSLLFDAKIKLIKSIVIRALF